MMNKLQIMKRAMFCAFVLVAGAAIAEPTLTTYYWASNETSLVSGSFNDKDNWLNSSCQPAASVPGALSLASFYHLPSAEYTVTLPEGVYTNYASLQIYSRQGKAVTIDGRGSVFVSPTTETENYHAKRIRFFTSNSATSDDQLSKFYMDDGGAGDYTSGYCLSNVVWRFKGRWNSRASIESIEFTQGLFNFYDFDGHPHQQRLLLWSSDPGSSNPKVDAKDQPISLTFGESSSLRIYDFYPVWQTSTGHALCNFNGGEHHIFGALHLFQNKKSDRTEAAPIFTDVHVGGNAVVRANVLKVWHGTASQYHGPNQRTLVAVENGGTLTATGGVQWATYNEQRLYVTNGAYCAFGPIDGSSARPVNNFANTIIMTGGMDRGIGTNIVNVVVDNARFDMIGDNRIGNVDISLRDSTFNLVGSASIGYSANRSARLYATNSTVAVDIDSSGKKLYIGSSGRGVVELVGSDMTLASNDTSLYIGNNLNSYGEFVLDGGSFAHGRAVKTTGNVVYVGTKGSGRLTVKDGMFEAYQLFVHYGESGTTCPTSIVHQTGGTIKITAGSFNNSEGAWYAARIGQTASESSVTKLVLDGGEFQSARLFAPNSVLNNPSRGCHTYFEADGGTIVGLTPSDGASNVITLRNFEKASLGSKGLTIRTSGETRTEQDFCDKEGSEGSGRLLLTGPGVKKLYGTNSTESVLVCAGGLTKFLPLSGVNACHLSHLVVTNNAAFSIAGDQDGAHFAAITLADTASGATFEMDSTDCVTVDGAMEIGGSLTLSLADAPSIGTYPLFVSAGEATTATKTRWAASRITGADHLGLVYSLSADYDSGTGKTTFSLTVTEGGPLTDEIVYQNDGSWDGAKIVKFTDDSPTAVSVGSSAAAGAVRFGAAKNFVLSGTGPLTFSDSGGYAAIETERGVQTIETPINMPRDTRITVASGATNAITGMVTGGGIVKDGRGTAQLTNAANELPGGVALEEGLLSATSTGVLGGAPITLSGGTLEIKSAGRLTSGVEIATGNAATAVVVKVDADVTMPAPVATLGALIKRGTGRLTFEAAGETSLCSLNSGTLANSASGGLKGVENRTIFDDEGNYNVDGDKAFGGLNVAEGELCLKGLSDDATFLVPAYLCIGISASKGNASPALVVDHAELRCTSQYIDFGGVRASAFATNVYLFATNKSTVAGQFMCLGAWGDSIPFQAYSLFDDSVQHSTFILYPNQTTGSAEYLYRNGSFLSTKVSSSLNLGTNPGIDFQRGAVCMTFDASTLGRKLELTDTIIRPTTVLNSVDNDSVHELVFTNGAAFYCSWVSNKYDTAKLAVRFAGGEWFPLVQGTSGDFTFDFGKRGGIEIEAIGDGLSLSPAAGCLWTFRNAITGGGKVVKKGAGALKFETPDVGTTVPWSFAGDLEVRNGTVLVAPGSVRGRASVALASGTQIDLMGGTATGLSVSGAGAVANGTLVAPTLKPVLADDPDDTMLPTISADVVVTDRLTIDFGRSADNPLPIGYDAPVAIWESGSDPSLLKVKAANTGSSATSGELSVVDGVLRCRLGRKGVLMIVF